MPSAAKASARRGATACAGAAWERRDTFSFWSIVHPGPLLSSEPVGSVQTEIKIQSPAGGGWGNRKKRDADLVLLDVRNGLLSRGVARTIYGVAARRTDAPLTRQPREHCEEGEA